MERDETQRSLFNILALAILALGLVVSVREYAHKDAYTIREQFNCQLEFMQLQFRAVKEAGPGPNA